MQDYIIVTFKNTQENKDFLIALLNDLSFDSFEEINENLLKAYILKKDFNTEAIEELVNSLPIFNGIEFEVSELENKNWNEEWEKNFQPILIADQCIVRAPFHEVHSAKYDLVIMPKMAFGTGHHATTEMVLSFMLGMDFKNKEVLDFGCGTGILSLLAEKMGAKAIDANDIEEPAFENTKENALLNNCNKIHAFYGDFSVLPSKKYAIILANVTTNTINSNLKNLYSLMEDSCEILLSGILEEQKEQVMELAQSLNLTFVAEKQQKKWVALHYSKK